METLILILFISTLTFQQTFGQDVEIRGGNDKVSVDDGGQTRTIYSQRHLSPHRMMHFGKRPMLIQPPTILTPQVFDLYKGSLAAKTAAQLQSAPASSASYLRPDNYPYLFSIELENGQTLSAVPEDLTSSIIQQLQVPNKQNYYTTSFDRQPEYVLHANEESQPSLRQQQQQQLQAQRQDFGEQKFLRLLQAGDSQNKSGDLINNDVNGERSQPSSNTILQEGDGQQQQQQSPQTPEQTISLSTRSMQSARSNTLNLPKAYISSLLYGKQSSSVLPNMGSYNKKAEPKGNFFMHFGRK